MTKADQNTIHTVVRQETLFFMRDHRMRPDEYDDLYQQGWVAAMSAYKRFDASKGVPLGAWVRPRVRGSMVDEIRRRMGHVRIVNRSLDENRLTASYTINPLTGTELREAARWFSGLTLNQRKVVVLTVFEDMTLRDAAVEIGMSAPSVHRLFHSAINSFNGRNVA